MKPKNFYKKFFTTILLLVVTKISFSQIVTDGTLGSIQDLGGSNVLIPEFLGQRAGENLFHSFKDFNVQTGQTATFTGSPDISNIISRVTGGQISSIKGTIASSIPGANLFLLNPAGFLFGPEATLNIQGSFHTSTADSLRLGESERFYSRPLANEVLSIAPPAAFGFLGNNSGQIVIQGSKLTVPQGKNMTIIAGEIKVGQMGSLSAGGDFLKLAAFKNSGDIELLEETSMNKNLSAFGPLSLTEKSSLDITSSSSGKIVLQGREVIVDDSKITAENTGMDKGKTIQVAGEVIEILHGSEISATTLGDEKGGEIILSGKEITISGENGSGDRTKVLSRGSESPQLQGAGGGIKIAADFLDVSDGAIVSVSAFGTGSAGTVLANVGKDLTMKGESPTQGQGATMAANSNVNGGGGNIEIKTENLIMKEGAILQNIVRDEGIGGTLEVKAAGTISISGQSSDGTFSGFKSRVSEAASGGNIDVQAQMIHLSDVGTIDSLTSGSGRAGDIEVIADFLTLQSGGGIASQTFDTGRAGDIRVDIENHLFINGAKDFQASEISSNSVGELENSGSAGDVLIFTDRLTLEKGGAISSTTFGSGNGGNVVIDVGDLIDIRGNVDLGEFGERASGIFTNAQGRDQDAGNAGNIQIFSWEFVLSEGGTISSSTFEGCGFGGDIILSVDHGITLDSQARILADSSGFGDAGSIQMSANTLSVLAGSLISSDAFFAGNAGNIKIDLGEHGLVTGGSLEGGLSTISTNSFGDSDVAGDAGKIMIEAFDFELKNGGILSSSTFGSGEGGNIHLNLRGELSIAGSFDFGDEFIVSSGIINDALGFESNAGDAGNIEIEASSIQLTSRGEISSSTFFGSGAGGQISLDASKSLVLDDVAGIFSFSVGLGDAGSINVGASDVIIRGGSTITSSTVDVGRGGQISISANTIEVEGTNSNGLASSIESFSENPSPDGGAGGSIKIQGGQILFSNGAEVNTSSTGGGSAGTIEINALNIKLANNAVIASESAGEFQAGNSGFIRVNAIESIELFGNSGITSEALFSGGGFISLNARELVYLENSKITTTVLSGKGAGGDITIDPVNVVLNNSQIIANAIGGNGGDIAIISESFIQSSSSLVQATSRLRRDGRIEISAPSSLAVTSPPPLNSEFLEGTNLLLEKCARRSADQESGLQIRDRERFRYLPGELLPNIPITIKKLGKEKRL